MGLFSRRNKEPKNYAPESRTGFKMIYEYGNGFTVWDGKVYNSDIIRSCIRPKVKALGKMTRKHIREGNGSVAVNPDPYIRMLLAEPNPYMPGQKFIEKLETQLMLNNNAFALICRDENGYATELYPINCVNCEAVYDTRGALSLKFLMPNGQTFQFSYDDIIHLRNDFNSNDIFGDSAAACIAPLMDIVSTMDQGIVKAIKNSAIIKWLLKFNSSMRDEDIKKKTSDFAENFLDVSKGTGVAAVDSKVEAQQVESKDYVPASSQMEQNKKRLYALFNINEKIVMSQYTEDEWNAYYEAEIEPDAIAFQEEFTRKIFSRRERGFGNRIVFDSVTLTTASMSTKLGLAALVDRSILSPNEARSAMNLPPRPGGDEFVLRKDTGALEGGET